MADASALLDVRHVSYHIPVRRGLVFPRRIGWLRAVEDASLALRPGETLSVVGESGAGKSTLGLLILGILKPSSGEILFRGRSLQRMRTRERRRLGKDIQIIFQNPFTSFNPNLRVGRSIELPLRNFDMGNAHERRERVMELLETVGLKPDQAERYPHEFSGGQAQRLAIARALATRPEFLVLDEAVSALDVSVQAQIINLLIELQTRFGLTFLFIAHDLSVVHHMSTRIAVMFRGHVVELGRRDEIFGSPQHPHTKALLSSILPIDRPGTTPRLDHLLTGNDHDDLQGDATGCIYRHRCPFREPICALESPMLAPVGGEHHVACHVAHHSTADWLARIPARGAIPDGQHEGNEFNEGGPSHVVTP